MIPKPCTSRHLTHLTHVLDDVSGVARLFHFVRLPLALVRVGAMPSRRVLSGKSTAAAVARWLLSCDWQTRHAYMNIVRRMPGKTSLVRQIRELMSPDELIDGVDTGITCATPWIAIPMRNAKPKRMRQSTLEEFFIKRPRT